MYNLVQLKSKYYLDDLFIPINNINNIGLLNSQILSNETFENIIESDKLIEQVNDLNEINVNIRTKVTETLI
jgi:hypothetical protein